MEKTDDIVAEVKLLVDKEYEKGRTTAMSNYELKEFVKAIDIDYYHKLKFLSKN